MGTCSACRSDKSQTNDSSNQYRNRATKETNMDQNPTSMVMIPDTDIPSNHWVYQILNDIPNETNYSGQNVNINEHINYYDESETATLIQGETSNGLPQNVSPSPPAPTLKLMSKSKPNLFRPNTTSAWDMDDIENLKDDMKQELQAMVSNEYGQSPMSEHDINMINVDLLDLSYAKSAPSNLIKKLSHDWDSEDMEEQENEMRKCLTHLKSEGNILDHDQPDFI